MLTACRDRWPRRAPHAQLSAKYSFLPPENLGCALASVEGTVDCWIGVVQEIDRRVVRLAGKLSGAQVPELLEACGQSDGLQLDLSDLVSADVAGIEALQRIRAGGASLTGVPGYIQLKLDSPGGRLVSPPPAKFRRS